MIKHIRYIILSICILLFSFVSFSQRIELKDGQDLYFILDTLYMYRDTSGSFTIGEVSAADFSGKFKNGTISFFDKDELPEIYWTKLTVVNNRDNENQSWYFESWNFDFDEIEFYVPDNKGGFFKTSMGYHRDFKDRNIFHKNFLFLIDLRPGEEATYYIKFKRSHPLSVFFAIRTHEDFVRHAVYEYWLLGILYGIFSLIILINLYLFFRLKEKIHLYYLLCVLSEVLYCFGRDGLGFQFLWKDLPWINYIAHRDVIQILFVASTILYAIQFLKLKAEQPSMYKVAISGIVTKGILFGILWIYPTHPFYVFSIDTVILSIPFVSGIISYQRGNKYARYYVIAFTFLFLSFFIIFIHELRIIPYTIFNWYIINFGMLFEVFFLAIALIDQIKILRAENDEAQHKIISQLQENEKLKDKVNLELEQKVEERTLELKAKNEELKSANEQLKILRDQANQWNVKLDIDNWNLKKEITELENARVFLKGLKFEEFSDFFPDENSCLQYLVNLKWEKGYTCKKCGNESFAKGTSPFSRRCTKCNYIESPISDTLFHALKFPITKAFYMVYLVNKDNDITADRLSEILSMRRETCWSFKKKILDAKKKNKNKSLDSEGWNDIIMASLD
ncbi:MAG: transposase [Cytophagaceae bacterium]|nr:transposase [Cytophagaceae bacterium]